MISTAEKKLLVVLCYYILFGVTALITFALYTARRDTLIATTIQYFTCEATGHVPGKCDRALFQQHDDIWWLFCVVYILLGLIPTVNLIFVVNFGVIQEKVLACCPCCKIKQKSTSQDITSNQSPTTKTLTSTSSAYIAWDKSN